MGLNKAQQEAVDYLEGPLLVIAGPGTGKTQLLSSKVKKILEDTDANPENILCITFTDAGAQNMRDRLARPSMIGQAAAKVNIFTYHAFGSSILGQYKNHNPAYDRDLDDTIDSVTQYKIISEILTTLPSRDMLRKTHGPVDSANQVIEAIGKIKAANLDSIKIRRIAESNIKECDEIDSKVSPILNGSLVPRMKTELALSSVYRPIADKLAAMISPTPIEGTRITKLVNGMAIDLQDAIDEAETSGKLKALSAWKDKYFEKDADKNYRVGGFVANHKLLSLSNVLEQYENYLAANGLFDYADMIQGAIQILKSDDSFRFTLQERYQYILLDEFQDTNPSQFELIKLLTDYEKPCVMAVGDDDQAIYEFQGASAGTFDDFRDFYGDVKEVVLTENYRSTAEILNLSRQVADQLQNSYAKLHSIKKVLESKRNDEILTSDPADTVINAANRIDSNANTDAPHSLISFHKFSAADSEYAWVAKQIHELIQTGEKQSNIAIITPKHKYITPLLPYLKSYDEINITYEKRENVLEDPYIHEVTTLARFVYEIASGQDPAYRLMEIFTFKCFEIPPVLAVTALQTHYGDTRKALDYLLQSDDQRLRTAAAFVSALVQRSFDTPLEKFINFLIGSLPIEIEVPTTIEKTEDNKTKIETETVEYTSPFLSFYTKNSEETYSTFNLYENLSVLRANLKNHIKVEKPRLKDFIDFLDDYEAANVLIQNTSPYQDSENCVQVMSAHKSKGLEFKHVFLIAVDDSAWGNSQGNQTGLTLPKNLEHIRHTGHTDDECIRLFFVALTRAEKTITMTSSKTDFSGKARNDLEYLLRKGGDEGSSTLLVENIIEHHEEVSETEREDNLKNIWISNYLDPTPELMPVLRKNVENYRLSATDLTTFIDIAYAGPIAFYQTRILHGPGEPATESMNFGNLVHATFEAVTKGKDENGKHRFLTDDEAREFFTAEVDKLDLDELERTNMLDGGLASINASLAAFGDILRYPNSRAEVNLSYEHLSYEGIPINGKIDHINIDEENKTIEIYDFKTSGYKAQDWEKHPTLYKYALQLGFYKLLLNMSPTYSKYKVVRAHILFVNPSSEDLERAAKDGIKSDIELVHDKVYEFSDAGTKDLTELCHAVYDHVKTLDFAEKNSPLAIAADSSRGIKDIKEFCEKVKTTAAALSKNTE